MCGIVGYVGKRNAQDVLLDGLEKLEYRGYDSAGVALALKGGIRVVKSKGRLAELRKRLAGRGTDGEEEIARRMQTAELELAQKHRFDRVIVSRSKDEDFAGLLAIWREAQQRVQAQA